MSAPPSTLDLSIAQILAPHKNEEKIFQLSLVISILIHILILITIFFANVHLQKKIKKNIEVVYYAEVRDIAENQAPRQDLKSYKEEVVSKPDILSRKSTAPREILNQIGKQPQKLEILKKQPSRIKSLGSKRHISIPMLDSEKITNPKYLNYHERIRNKIKNRAYFYVDDPRFATGEVYLTFVLSRDGQLQDLKILDDKTNANNYLRSIGVRSIKESSPFPAFPEDLGYPELSFNVVISFKIDE